MSIITSINFVRLSDLREEFKGHASWSDLNDDNSTLVNFLKEFCPFDIKNSNIIWENSLGEVLFDELKLKGLGVLFCHGKIEKKSHELFDTIQEGGKGFIAAKDREFKVVFNWMLELASDVACKQASKVMNLEPGVTKDQLEQASTKHNDLYVEFIDAVFGYDAVLSKAKYIRNVLKSAPWLLDSKKIREKLFEKA